MKTALPLAELIEYNRAIVRKTAAQLLGWPMTMAIVRANMIGDRHLATSSLVEIKSVSGPHVMRE
jgi:hypothetical protein